MHKPSIITVVCTILLLAGFGCDDVKNLVPKSVPDDVLVSPDVSRGSGAPVVKFGGEIITSAHSKIDYPDGLQFEITEIKDTRCAEGAVCPDPGEVTIKASLKGGVIGQVPKEVTLSTVHTKFVKESGYFVFLSESSGTTAKITISRPPPDKMPK